MRFLLLALLIVAGAAAADAPKPAPAAGTPPAAVDADAAARAIQAEIRAEMKNTGGDRHEAEVRVAARHPPGRQVTPADEAAAKAAIDAQHAPKPAPATAK